MSLAHRDRKPGECIAGGTGASPTGLLGGRSGGQRRVELEIRIDAPPERVFRALLDPADVCEWMGCVAPTIDVERGVYSYGWTRGAEQTAVGPLRILQLVPNRLLVHDWQWGDEPPSQVRWELSPAGAGTQLCIVHDGSTDVSHALGWADALIAIRSRLIPEPADR